MKLTYQIGVRPRRAKRIVLDYPGMSSGGSGGVEISFYGEDDKTLLLSVDPETAVKLGKHIMEMGNRAVEIGARPKPTFFGKDK